VCTVGINHSQNVSGVHYNEPQWSADPARWHTTVQGMQSIYKPQAEC